jgi:hypothetical protein
VPEAILRCSKSNLGSAVPPPHSVRILDFDRISPEGASSTIRWRFTHTVLLTAVDKPIFALLLGISAASHANWCATLHGKRDKLVLWRNGTCMKCDNWDSTTGCS